MGKADWSAEQRWWRLSTPILKSLYNRARHHGLVKEEAKLGLV